MPYPSHVRRFGEKLRQLRIRQQLTMQTLAAQLGTSSGYISNVENGKVTPNMDFAVRVALFFKVSTDQLLRDDCEVAPRTASAAEDADPAPE
jgi:transcriptional regulator with XRE-family HTH domain